jgi:transcriptional regulator with XRE-family HTH domain
VFTFDRRIFLYTPVTEVRVIRLKFERTNRGFSQKGLAYIAKVPQPVICLIETGKWNPTADDLDALARALGVSPPSALMLPVRVEPDEQTEARA